jgi:two-component system phosphate regulon sensor histidine kinase PhoR
MITWFLGILALIVAVSWWLSHRRTNRQCDQLKLILDEIASDRTPRGLFFLKGSRFAELSQPLGKLVEDRERSRLQLDREEFNLRTILASMEEGVMVTDARHAIRLVNGSFKRIFELKGEPLGQSVLETLREPEIEEMITIALASKTVQTREIAASAGRFHRHFGVHMVPVQEAAGQPSVVTIFRDISRLKQLEDVRREFVANVSHELRTPLSIFRGYLENLQDDPDIPREEQTEIFGILRRHSERLNALLEDLLALARLESRQEVVRPESINLATFFRQVGEDWNDLTRKKKIRLTMNVPEGLPELQADRLKLEQILNNLFENALKYTGSGGEVRLTVSIIDQLFELRFADTGTGIPPNNLAHIFERFYRADKARTRDQGGTGLGLSIVKHIIHAHNGTVLAESDYGKGTTIIVRLPINGVESEMIKD